MKYSIKPIAFRPEWVEILGDIESAILYQQFYYWSDKGSRVDGYIYKTRSEIEYETTLTRYQQERVVRKMVTKGYLQVKKIKANGVPTLHYKICKWICDIPANGNARNSQMEMQESDKSLTEITTENTTDIANAHFSSFWEKYPKRIGKGQAFKAFKAALKKTDLDTILKAVGKQSRSWNDPKYIPHPSTWLNGERWEDETETTKTNKSDVDILLGK